jgi:glycine hydroxymethyltransferase
MATSILMKQDAAVAKGIAAELKRQREGIELIASENYVSAAVLEAQGSVLTNKYAEGYPGKRYYGGCAEVDVVEQLAIDRAKKLFGCQFANVQPHAGSQTNQAVYFAFLQPGDSILGLRLDQGGHLTHGHPANLSGKWLKAHFYGLNSSETIDYDGLEYTANQVRPKLISAGASAYPRVIDFERIGRIAKSVGAIFLVDMAHIAGLVAAGEHPNPFPHADVVTTTTHKTLRGPRGGLILTNNEEYAKKLNSAIFPGLQGGPLEHIIAAKAVAFGEALKPGFRTYIKNVKKNCKALAGQLSEEGLRLVSGGTDNHLCLVDLRPIGVTGKVAEEALDAAGLTTNKNTIPNDPEKPTVTSGLRLGSAAGTTRGFNEKDFKQIGMWIAEVLRATRLGDKQLAATQKKVRAEVLKLCKKYPLYPEFKK